MDFSAILIISIILGLDAFSLSLGIGLKGVKRKQIYILAFLIGFFHMFLPLLGLYLGRTLGTFVGPIAGKIGACVLIFIGAQALWQKWRFSKSGGNEEVKTISLDSAGNMIILALSVSLDALTVGFGLGALQARLALTVISIGLVAGIMTLLGFFCGSNLSHRFGENAEIIGNILLIMIGMKLFFY